MRFISRVILKTGTPIHVRRMYGEQAEIVRAHAMANWLTNALDRNLPLALWDLHNGLWEKIRDTITFRQMR